MNMEKVFEFLERIGPACSALFGTACIAFIVYMVFVDWREKKERWYKERIADLESQLARAKGELNASLQKQCDMAYLMNDSDASHKQELEMAEAQVRDANARAEGDKKRADRMAEIADEFRDKANAAA